MKTLILKTRASGNTTRCVDSAIQDLFNNRAATLSEFDYDPSVCKSSNKEFENLVLQRLKHEHGMVRYILTRNHENNLILRLD